MNIQKSIIYGLLLVTAQSSNTSNSRTFRPATIKWAYEYNSFFKRLFVKRHDLKKTIPFYGQKEKVTTVDILLPKRKIPALYLVSTLAGASYMYALHNNIINLSPLAKSLIPILGIAAIAQLRHRFYKPHVLNKTANILFLANTTLIESVERGETFNSSWFSRKKGIFVPDTTDATNSSNRTYTFYPLPESKSFVSKIKDLVFRKHSSSK